MKKFLIIFLIFTVNYAVFSQDLTEENNRNYGMFFDGGFTGGVNLSIAIGFTFLDEMLKFQLNYFPYIQAGQISQSSGWGLGTKIIGAYNFNYYETFLSTSVGLGFELTHFFMDSYYLVPSIFGQWEFIKIDFSYHFENMNYFHKLSFFVQPQLWFIPLKNTDENSWHTPFTIGFGGRISLF